MTLRVYGVVMHDGEPTKLPDGVQLLPLRELAAVFEEGDFRVHDAEPEDVARHHDVIGALFNQDPVLPTPVGTIFRTRDVLQRWMDLHYVALSDALAWVDGRVAARVHITRAAGRTTDKEAGSDLADVASEITRTLRRNAVSSVPLRNEEVTGVVLTAAYLVERDLWGEFVQTVEAEGDKHQLVRLDVTGPWPPYDFVRMQFGA